MGTSDSGKTTLGRQIRMLHGDPFGKNEMLHFKHLVRASCLEDFATILVEYIALQIATSNWTEECELFISKMRHGGTVVDRYLMDLSLSLWKDVGMQKHLSELNLQMNLMSNEEAALSEQCTREGKTTGYQSDDPGYHFLPHLDKIMAHGYEPTLSDILSMRITTTGK